MVAKKYIYIKLPGLDLESYYPLDDSSISGYSQLIYQIRSGSSSIIQMFHYFSKANKCIGHSNKFYRRKHKQTNYLGWVANTKITRKPEFLPLNSSFLCLRMDTEVSVVSSYVIHNPLFPDLYYLELGHIESQNGLCRKEP